MGGEKLEKAVGVAAWLGPLGAVDPLAAVLAEEDFHDAVLERVEGDYRQTGTWCETLRKGVEGVA
jgi:hypothetical protein